MRQVLPFDWFTADHLVSGESTLHRVTGYEFTGYTFLSSIENFSAYCNPVLRGSILLPPRHPSVFDGSLAMSEIVLGGTNLSVKQLLKKIGDKIFQDRFTNLLTNWEWIWIRVGVEILESAKKNLRIQNIRIRVDGRLGLTSFHYYDQNPSGFAFLCKLRRLLSKPRWDRFSKFKCRRKNEKGFGPSSKIAPSCK